MAKYTGPKNRLSRREGFDLFGKGVKMTRLNVPPGQHGPKGLRGSSSEYAKQLREKQKVRRLYGVLERQFRKYVELALKTKGNTGETLLAYLERRLDNVVYRLGFAPTRFSARQLVSHGHVTVNGKKVNIPSYQLKVGETVSLSKKGAEIPEIKAVVAKADTTIPAWLSKKAIIGIMKSFPKKDDVPEPISEQDVVEYYSR